jgi:UPF0755 protein
VKVMKALFLILVLLVVAGGAVAGYLAYQFNRFVHTPFGDESERVIEVGPGATLAEVTRKLEAAGIVSDSQRFRLYGRIKKAEHGLRRGEFAFEGAQTPQQVLSHLLNGKFKTYKVTVPEGLRADEIGLIFQAQGVVDKDLFVAAVRNPLVAGRLKIPGPSAEGFLYPDTYLVPKGRRAESIVAEMVDHFKTAYARALAIPDPWPGLNELQTVTLASIIEKETGAASERAHISCVFHNRLRDGMRLATDPSVIYAVILATGKFDGNLTKEMLLTPHPYNTYLNAGLPPGPITNPGYDSIVAALHPEVCKDLYFVARGDGTSAFCPTYACHDKNVRKYQIAPAHHAHPAPSSGSETPQPTWTFGHHGP